MCMIHERNKMSSCQNPMGRLWRPNARKITVTVHSINLERFFLKMVWRKDKLLVQESPNKPVYHDLLGGGTRDLQTSIAMK